MDIGKISSWKGLSGIVADSRTLVEPPSPEMFKKCVEVLRTWFEGPFGLMILEVFSNLSDSLILRFPSGYLPIKSCSKWL